MKLWRFLYIVILLVFVPDPYLFADPISAEAKKKFSYAIEIIEKAKGFNDYIDAEERLDEVVTLEPTWAEAYYNLGLVCGEIGKYGKAIKSYQKYLELTKDTALKSEVEVSITRLQRIRQLKREIGVVWENFRSLKNGIYVVTTSFGGLKIKNTDLQEGDKIITLNSINLAGISLEEFFKLIKNAMDNEKLDKLSLKIIRGDKEINITVPKEAFRTNIYEIDESEIEEEVIKSDKRVFLIFLSYDPQNIKDFKFSSSSYAEFMNNIEELASQYKNEIKFITINAYLNRKIAEDLKVRGFPYCFYEKEKGIFKRLLGSRTKEELNEFMKTGIDKRGDEIKLGRRRKVYKPKPVLSQPTLKAIPILKSSPNEKVGIIVEKEPNGMRIVFVDRNSPAEKFGLKRGFLVVRVNDLDLKNTAEEKFIKYINSEKTFILYVVEGEIE